MPSLDVNDIKDFSISPETQIASFTLVTKYAGDLGIRIPVTGLKMIREASALEQPKAAPQGQPATKPGELMLAVAAKWLVAVDKKHGIAVVVSNPGTPTQSGFGLKPKNARELAAALIKQAEAIETASAEPN